MNGIVGIDLSTVALESGEIALCLAAVEKVEVAFEKV